MRYASFRFSSSWKGNVRELENTIERLLILRESETISHEDLPSKIKHPQIKTTSDFIFTFPPEGVGLEDAEKALIEAALSQTRGNQSQAARLLKIPRHILTYRMEKFNISKKG